MNCPTDGETLLMSERKGVEIDYCPRCRGVWLDRGELDKLLQVADRDDDDRWDDRDRDKGRYDTDRHRDRDRHDSDRPYGARRKKKSSFLSEMFEFGD
jgi:Zn-finger nucleic acid-binding protein